MPKSCRINQLESVLALQLAEYLQSTMLVLIQVEFAL